MAKLLYQGHGSFRLIGGDGVVIFIDPFAGAGYDPPADAILITHQHDDHNQTDLITQKPGCVIITEADALAGGKYNTFTVSGVGIEAVMAQNKNHSPDNCVGYIVTIDGIKVYFSGDTSKTPQMEEFAAKKIDYALLCCDGFYNMGLEEAAECAQIIGARHNVPVHIKPGALFDRELAEQYKGPNRLIVADGEEIELV